MDSGPSRKCHSHGKDTGYPTAGYPQELCTMSKLQQHIRSTCKDAGYPILEEIAVSKKWTILNDAEIKNISIIHVQNPPSPDA